MRIRVVPLLSLSAAMVPVCWMSPVNISVLGTSLLCASPLAFVRILYISLDSKIFSEAVQRDRANACSFADVGKAWPASEWYGSRAGEDLGCVKQEHLVDYIRGKRRPIYERTPFDGKARDL